MPAAWIAGGTALVGGLLGGANSRQASSQAADAQVRAAEIAAEASKFKPVGTTTRFGSSNFGYDDKGNLTSAGYTMSPELKAQQDAIMAASGGALNQAGMNASAGQGLFGLGQQYAATDPQAAAAQWMQQQNALLQPGNDQAYAAVQQGLQNSGRSGLSIAQGGTLASANPELSAYYNSLAKQQALLASQATAEGRNQVNFGAGLMGTGIDLQSAAYNPYKTQFNLATGLESAAQAPLDISSQLAGRTTAANQYGATGLLNASNSAARLNYDANKTSPWATAITGLGSNQQFINGIQNWMTPSTSQQIPTSAWDIEYNT